MTHVDAEWQKLKEITVEHTVGYQPKPDNRGWFEEECKADIDEKNLCTGTNYEVRSNEEDINNRCKTYFQDLLNATTVEHNTFLDNTHTNETETEKELENEPQHIFDIDTAKQSMRNKKAPDTDNIHIKLYKKG